jgi:hypothetical protein
MNPELRDRSLLVALLLVAWASLVYAKTVLNASVLPDLNAIIAQVQVLMGGVVGYHVGTGAGQPGVAFAPSAAAPPAAQAGFASVRLLIALAALALGLSLAGCTTTTASLYSGIYTQAKAGVQVFDDNTLATMTDLLCAQPYAAIQRHPEKQAGIAALCGSMASGSALDPGQVMQMLSIAKQLGLVPAPVPAKP